MGSQILEGDICVVGGGSAGLSVAAGATQMGARTILIEAGRMGGECLNSGCVPSKSLLACAKAAKVVREAARYGLSVSEPRVDFSLVHDYVQRVIRAIAPHDSVERFTALGCTVVKGYAHFIDDRTVEAAGRHIRARRFVIATGSRPAIPPIPGLDTVPYFTNETLFDNTCLPDHLIIVGAGPIGCEMAQAHRRLGSKVTVLDLGPMLPKDDPEAAAVVRRTLTVEGVALIENVKIVRIEQRDRGVRVIVHEAGNENAIDGSHLLVAAGRIPNFDDLDLKTAGVRFGAKGIDVDRRLRTTNRRIYAAGDVVGGYQFTHVAAYHAGIILRNALFRFPAKTDLRALPWVTYTDPELAQVGMTEAEARHALGTGFRVLRADFTESDRAQTEGATDGFVKAIVSRRGYVVGATIVGQRAGELLMPWALAIAQRSRIGSLTGIIAAYPTLSELSKRAAGTFYAPMLFSRRTRAVVRFLGMFG
ncbi:Pyruvate/2-oxoglutarate dehydrogenase complex, dihydrolipoamide dehydrogenase (E3) component [Enhydrobacter aerosaccus]|uniref:Pyruvate/2-oxoglutarate dehydrogenase complex, dihydrolipoamide dehydrogenase (E3) component n=1 Tax=Enhydrobacter aerosaccus TaxID=225324 RepID=A0A1T4SAT5_9HYPH|nr:FAD-dependent oxidoreductase [Enhydrobacter aerosaccus]SKA24961.1 Pyruvate/2-oxoglutarate dehydrogenase complex, dihydrolipoamide dehydrogenase (E3) component [Enhydrobacter aerosaccus]